MISAVIISIPQTQKQVLLCLRIQGRRSVLFRIIFAFFHAMINTRLITQHCLWRTTQRHCRGPWTSTGPWWSFTCQLRPALLLQWQYCQDNSCDIKNSKGELLFQCSNRESFLIFYRCSQSGM